jgi:hypothetical protein
MVPATGKAQGPTNLHAPQHAPMQAWNGLKRCLHQVGARASVEWFKESLALNEAYGACTLNFFKLLHNFFNLS